jgi:hypothetical protein
MTAPTLTQTVIPRTNGLSDVVITPTVTTIAGVDVHRITTHLGHFPGGTLIEEHTKSFATADGAAYFAAMVEGYYTPIPDTIAEIAPAEQPTPRTPTAAALANLTIAGWSVAKIGAELGVTRTAVYRWRKGNTPNARNLAALLALSADLAKVGDGCGCRGFGVILTGDTWAGGTLAATYGRCVCNPKESK